jgi:capsular exopolysaccharide synthesis family protein
MRATSPLVIVGLLGVSLVFLLVILRRVRANSGNRLAEFVTDHLKLFILGVVPRIGRTAAQGGEAESQAVVDAFKTIRTNAQYAVDPGGAFALVITSAGPSEGKSLVASNLALSFAESGMRTLLVDAHLARGELARTFGVEPVPGLVQVLDGTATVDATLRTCSAHTNLTILPCGTAAPGASSLLVESELRELFHNLAMRYDVVLVDAPSLQEEASVIALWRAAGNTALVLRAGVSDQDAIVAACAKLASHNVRALGAILNAVSTQ